MKFNKQILSQNGFDKWNDNELIQMLKDKIQYLSSHNKNYTKTQYYLIEDIKDIVVALT
jgi:hypothetical protein